eukprot:TRINITY_DN44925_c0_g1_i1.p1 TRINITY_DN44925_c0_g1~~TRINITY_DN44925_c0_g1_i1.p1  ORF type:complete len:398 (+),score=63.50 TRINITY_DN44925_c0_g1_i1:65-1258(+)
MVPRVAIVGGGVAGSALVYGLREESKAGRILLTVIEMGRAAGGRAATRRTREKEQLRVDHGAPAFSVRTPQFQELCDNLQSEAAVAPVTDAAFGCLGVDGEFVAEAPARLRFNGGAAGMAGFCDALLRGCTPCGNFLADRKYGAMVRGVERAADGTWTLLDGDEGVLGNFDWLMVSGSGIAHPRWTATFGGPPPLAAAAEKLGDDGLNSAICAIAAVESRPVTAALFAFEGEPAKAWAALPWAKAIVQEDAVLARIVVQRVNAEMTAVVLHSTHAFAERVNNVYGQTSTAARVGGAASDASREKEVLDEMIEKLHTRMVPRWLSAESLVPAWGPHLHRWGNAFPCGSLMDSTKAFVPSARIVFLGDYIEGDRAGSVEGAVLSGLNAAAALKTSLRLN